MPVLGIEAIEHRIEPGGVREHVDDVGRHIAACRLEVLDHGPIGGQELVGWCVGGH
jgi:hypothetical protein